MNFLVNNCNVSACTQGVFARQSTYYVNPTLSLPTVRNCKIDNVLHGIVFLQNDDSNPQIFNDTISKPGLSAISVMDISSGLHNRSYIYNNLISLSGGGWPNGAADGSNIGIRLTTTRNAAVCRNNISHSPDGDQAICISAEGSALATITNNATSNDGAPVSWCAYRHPPHNDR